VITAIVFLPLLAAIVAGLGNRLIGNVPAKLVTTGALFVSMFLSWPIFIGFLNGTQHSDVRQVFAMFVLTVAAAEAAIGLAILVIYFRGRGTIAVDDINQMKG
jgi:NADH:ubiquinone oxidoreductase subunit K